MNIKRYIELATIQQQDLLTFEEQEEYIAISTEMMNLILSSNEEAQNILKRLSER
jgi:hypothetical protein